MAYHCKQLTTLHGAFTRAFLCTIIESEHDAWHKAFAEGFELGEEQIKQDLACFFREDFNNLIEDKSIGCMGNFTGWRHLPEKPECTCERGTGCRKTPSVQDQGARKRRRILWSEGKLRTRISQKAKVFELTDDEQANEGK